MSEHVHDWQRSNGFVIDTMPPQYPHMCDCGAFTHYPETGEPCSTCAPLDYTRRSTDLITLSGGDADGTVIVRPVNRSVRLRYDPTDKRVQRHLTYKQSEDRDVWVYYSNDWTFPLEPRAESVPRGQEPATS